MASRTQSGGFLGDLRLNANAGHLSYYAMRITGIALAVYVFAHIYSLHFVTNMAATNNPWDGINGWNKMVGAYDSAVGTSSSTCCSSPSSSTCSTACASSSSTGSSCRRRPTRCST